MMFQLYAKSAVAAFKGIVHNPIAVVGIFAMHLVFFISAIFIQELRLGYAGGMILSFLFLTMLTIGYGVCENICNERSRVRWDDFKRLDWSLFSALINVGFILWLVSFTLENVLPRPGATWIIAGFNIIALFILNPSPEIAILKRLDGMSAITYSFEFMKRRTFEWVLPIVILLAPYFYLNGINAFILRTAGADVLFPPSLLLAGIDVMTPRLPSMLLNFIVIGIIHSVVGLWIMLFRISLFERLDSR